MSVQRSIAALVLAVVAALFAVVGGFVGWSWIEAKRDENAQLTCLVRLGPRGTEVEPTKVDGRRLCVYRDRSGRVVRTVPAATDIGRVEAAYAVTIAALIAAGAGAVAATVALAIIWLLRRLVRRAAMRAA